MEKGLVFVAFGDSLTVGYQSPTPGDELPRPTPYTEFLKERIEKMSDLDTARAPKVEFLNRGVVGDSPRTCSTVLIGMSRRSGRTS